MKKIILPTSAILVLSLVLYLHLNGMYEHWYVNYDFFDLLVHFLGGVGITLSAFYILKNTKYVILITIIAGILWEIFEVYFDITGWPLHTWAYKLDTLKDLLVDTLGAISVWITIKYKK